MENTALFSPLIFPRKILYTVYTKHVNSLWNILHMCMINFWYKTKKLLHLKLQIWFKFYVDKTGLSGPVTDVVELLS